MIHSIQPVTVAPNLPIQGLGGVAAPEGADAFKNLLVDSLRQLDAARAGADAPIAPPAGGHDLVGPLATLAHIERTDVALGVMMQIQDKLLGAYHEIQNIRV